MSQTTLTLMPQTAYVNPGGGAGYTVTGNSQLAAGYYLSSKSLQTVNLNLAAVTGNISIEATLASSPSATDWFEVYALVANVSAPAESGPLLASNANVFTNVEGNFVSIRAKITEFKSGTINFIKVSY